MRLLVLGTGAMAHQHAKQFTAMDGVALVAGVDTNSETLAAFGAAHGIDARFSTLTDALAWGSFDAAANVTPDGVHHETTMALLQAGKHVFCEKPLATNHADAAEMAATAQAGGLVNMVNLTYRNVSAIQSARQLIADGAVGTIRHFDAAYLQSWLTQPAWGDWRTDPKWLWRLSSAHGSHGVLGDVGIHILDFARYALDQDVAELSARLKTFDKAPPDNRIGAYVLDANDSFAMHVETDGGAIGTISATRFAAGHLNDLTLQIWGTDGGIEVTNSGDLGTLRTCLGADMETRRWTDVPLAPIRTSYQKFADAVRGDGPMDPDFAHAARLQLVLDTAIVSDARGARVRVAAG